MLKDRQPVSFITAREVAPITEDEWYSLAEAADWQEVPVETEAEAQAELVRQSATQRVFTLFLPLFDGTLSKACRLAVAEEIEETIAKFPDSLEMAFHRFHAAPFPKPECLDEAIALAREAGASELGVFVRKLSRSQPLIAEVTEAWAQIPTPSFPETLHPELARSVLVETGVFARLVSSRAQGHDIGAFFGWELRGQAIERLPGAEDWLRQWTQPFYSQDAAQARETEDLNVYQSELEAWKKDVLELATTKLEWAKQAALRLKTKQLERGHPRFAAMTLCDLAMRSKHQGLPQAQLGMAELAVRTNPHDQQCHCQLADALKSCHQFERALAVYDDVLAEYKNNAVAKCGRAEVLRDLGRLADALAAYDQTIMEHKDDAVAKNGRAEVLRDLGRLDDALGAYDQTIVEHKDYSVAKCGRAEVLRALGRLDDALAAYEQTILAHKSDAVAKNGRAEVLRDLGRLEEALDAYEQTTFEHKNDAFAKNGRAEVLRAMGRLEAALDAYDQTILEHKYDAVAKCGRAEVLRDLGRLEDALDAYDQTLLVHTNETFAKNGRAEVLRDLGLLEAALAAYNQTILAHKNNAVAKCGRAEVLRDLGRFEDALVAYNQTFIEHKNHAVAKNGAANILARLGMFDRALELLPTKPVSVQDWVGYHLRGMVLLRKGDKAGAKAIFDEGCAATLPRKQAQYFRAASAFLCLQQNDGKRVLELLPEVQTGRLAKVIPLLRAHAYGEMGEMEACLRSITPAIALPNLALRSTAQEIRDRYVDRNPKHTQDWLFEQELELMAMAA